MIPPIEHMLAAESLRLYRHLQREGLGSEPRRLDVSAAYLDGLLCRLATDGILRAFSELQVMRRSLFLVAPLTAAEQTQGSGSLPQLFPVDFPRAILYCYRTWSSRGVHLWFAISIANCFRPEGGDYISATQMWRRACAHVRAVLERERALQRCAS